jgi:hypothetical protein
MKWLSDTRWDKSMKERKRLEAEMVDGKEVELTN